MTRYDDVKAEIAKVRRRWLVTGGAGFIGSHLAEQLVALGQEVRVLDNFSTGKTEIKGVEMIRGDIADPMACEAACDGVEIVLHQAALGSVPRSIADPINSHRANVDGFVEMLKAARDAKVKRFVYASSSSVYGDHPALPKVEQNIGEPLSPYAATKRINEIYAAAWQRTYGLECIGLRYFNVFGPRQDPNGPYAAVIPKWVAQLLKGETCVINGDGETSRDFCYVENAVQANLLSAWAPSSSTNEVYNVGCGARTTLLELFAMLRDALGKNAKPAFAPFRPGDVRHSLADISKAREKLGYAPTHDVATGIKEALSWYAANV